MSLVAASVLASDSGSEESKCDSVEIRRKAAFLPSRRCYVKTFENGGYEGRLVTKFQAYVSLFSGSFLNLAQHDLQGIQAAKAYEIGNLGLVSALLFAVAVPLFTEESHFLDEQNGSSVLTESLVWSWILRYTSADESSFVDGVGDVSMILYAIPVLSTGLCTVACIVLSLAYGTLKDDESVASFCKLIGNPHRLPFIACTLCVLAIFGVIVRLLLLVRRWWAFIILFSAWAIIGIGMLHVSLVPIVQTLVNVMNQRAAFERLSLSDGEVREDVAIYVEHMGEDACIADCLDAMCGVTPSGIIVELGGLTQIRVAHAIRQQLAARLGMTETQFTHALELLSQ